MGSRRFWRNSLLHSLDCWLRFWRIFRRRDDNAFYPSCRSHFSLWITRPCNRASVSSIPVCYERWLLPFQNGCLKIMWIRKRRDGSNGAIEIQLGPMLRTMGYDLLLFGWCFWRFLSLRPSQTVWRLLLGSWISLWCSTVLSHVASQETGIKV